MPNALSRCPDCGRPVYLYRGVRGWTVWVHLQSRGIECGEDSF